jgi:replicative DNA helicase
MSDRIPPNDLEAEMAVLGAMLIERDMCELVTPILEPRDFYAYVHQEVYAAIRHLYERREPIDKITLATFLRSRNSKRRTPEARKETLLDDVGGLPYLTSLLNQTPTAASAEYYAGIVAEKAALRRLIKAGSDIVARAFDGELDVETAIADAQRVLSLATDRATTRAGGRALYDGMMANLALLRGVTKGDVGNRAQVTPFPSLNHAIGPFVPGAMVLWAAPAKMGKTGLMIMQAEFNARYGLNPLFSIEMTDDEIVQRYTAQHARVAVHTQREGNLTPQQLQQIEDAAKRFQGMPFPIYDRRSVRSLSDIRRELRHLAKQGPIGSFTLDGLHRLSDLQQKTGERTTMDERFDRVYQGLLDINSDFQCTCHVTVHINRTGAQKEFPTMNDLRGGGNPEGSAHAVILPHRPFPVGSPQQQIEAHMIVGAIREGQPDHIRGFEFIGARALWLDPLHRGRAWFDALSLEPEPEPEPVEYFGYSA